MSSYRPDQHYTNQAQGEPTDEFLAQVFRRVDTDRSGSITANELGSALSNGTWTPFNPETVRMMIGKHQRNIIVMLHLKLNRSTTINLDEFKSLWHYILQWERAFRGFDKDQNGSIDKTEFRDALTTFGMFDQDQSATIDFQEFKSLWKYVSDWERCFRTFDLDHSGTIDKHELKTALASFGYRLSDRFYDLLIKKFDRSARGTVAFDDFIQACVSIQTLTNAFRHFDRQQNGYITIGYEDFLSLVFSLKM
ncbi:unnamed protein product [Didymodactylos carnosus]|uniref:EF-hand domain-containing protein n=1 Tax=Didymodactylos carnosus TaxID=1234261 RepID=A0A813RKF0_9BILA|nr:unnamed protein product [Didymodactylos carnosus]CAF0795183.1 unnamed protein product [Didymodactylos carnosus]CAF3564892.1 unnamed protein product [Didymodactylos carnosus]CAF3578140.1 unnamed protein product [Didymodactylos carnosus]